MKRKYDLLTDDDYETVYLLPEWNNGDWNLRLAIRIMYMEQWASEPEILEQGKYEIKIIAISPEAAGFDEIKKAYEYLGIEDTKLPFEDKTLDYYALLQYGVYAPLVSYTGFNLKEMLRGAKKEAVFVESLFGMYMDMPVNRLGNTGWDAICGKLGIKPTSED